jgi:hypothetical protein
MKRGFAVVFYRPDESITTETPSHITEQLGEKLGEKLGENKTQIKIVEMMLDKSTHARYQL